MKTLSRLCFLLGTLMILSAAALLMYNRWDNDQAGTQAEEILTQLEQALPSVTVPALPVQEPVAEARETEPPREMTIRTIDGEEYIGFLSVPALGLDLPVLSQWSYEGLRKAPGRFCGSVYTGNLVICAHNYASHFGQLPYLDIGSSISFTDMDGVVWSYTLAQIETLAPDQLEEMTEFFPGEAAWDMTLFTCTPGGQARVALRLVSQ